MIHISRVRPTPRSSREQPYRFENLLDAAAYSRITRVTVWCVIGPDPDLFRVYPGGRIEDYTLWLETPQAKALLGRAPRGSPPGNSGSSVPES
jgi:hypothetical protein